jgi:hypothetical protein
MHSSMVLLALGCYPSITEGGGSSSFRKPTSSIECEVAVAVGQVEEEGPAQEILHCNLDEPDEFGNILYEIKGLEEQEFERIKDEVTSFGATRYEFPGSTRSEAKPATQSLFGGNLPATTQALNVRKSDNFLPQVIEKENEDKRGKGRRSLYNLQGVSKVLAVRIVALDSQTTHSENDCRAHTFGGLDDEGILDDMNMKSQIDACSYGKLKFVEPEYNPAYPYVVGGVVTIHLNETVTGVSHGTVLGWARATTPLYAGPLENFDHVMYFMPPGTNFGGAAAFGYVPGRETWYVDSYALGTGIQLHELGHNMGLGHSGEDGGGYGDASCYMGYGGGDVRMCYNAAKSWYLGWFSEFHDEFNPLETNSKLFKLVGLSDYNEALSSADPSAYTIVLRIETFEAESLYLTYNRQKGVNINVKEFQDEVTVVKANGSKQSWAEAGLAPGQKFSTAIVDKSGRSIEVVMCERVSGSPDYAVVSVHQFGDAPLCTPQSPIPSWDSYSGSLRDGLIAHYTFDDSYLDTSGNRNHAFEFGSPSFTPDGAIGHALSFDGVDDYVELPNIPELAFGTNDFTLTFWYKVSGDQVGRPAIIGNKDWRSASNPGWIVSSNYGSGSNGDDLAINLSDGNTTIDGSKAVDVGRDSWHFVAVRIKRGDKMSLLRSDRGSYVLQEDSISTLTGSLNTSNKIRIGTSHEGCSADFTKMDLDDLGIWSRALSSEEIDAIWMAGRKKGLDIMQVNKAPNTNDSERPGNMIAQYDFENEFVDSSVNDLAGVLTDGGGVSFRSSTEGYYLNLSNVDFEQKSFVTLPSSSLLEFGLESPFTVAVWIRTTTDFSSGGTSIISNKDWRKGSNPGWTLGVGSNGRYEFNVGDGSSRCDYDGPAGAINDGEWHHVAFSLSRGSAGQLTLFLDAKVVEQKACGVNSVSSGYPTVIGTDGRGGGSYAKYFSGDIDKLMIFASALEHSQILELYLQGQSDTVTFAPSASPTTSAPVASPTMRPTASPVTDAPTPSSQGPYYIRNPKSGNVLTIDGGCGDGTNIIPNQNVENDLQIWMLNYDGSIESVHCRGMVVAFEGTQCSNSASVVISSKDDCDNSQTWNLREDGVIVNTKCNTKAVDIAGGTNIIIWSIHGNNNQLWELVEAAAPPSFPSKAPVTAPPSTAPVTSNPSSAPVTASPSAAPVTAAPSAAPSSTSPSQSPSAAPITSTPSASPVTSAPTVSPDGPFYIKNPSTGKLMSIDGGICDDGANIVLLRDDKEDWQQWTVNHDNTFESVHCPGMVVGFAGTQCGNLVSVILSSKGEDGQTWTLQDGVMVNNLCNTKAIDIQNGSTSNGANLILYNIHGNWNQQWETISAVASPSLSPTKAPLTLAPSKMPATNEPTPSPSASPSISPSASSSASPSAVSSGNGPQNAVFDSSFGAPRCTSPGNSCSSENLLNGRRMISNGPEPNEPNTLDGCLDGQYGVYQSDETIEKVVVRSGDIDTPSGEDMKEGDTVTIIASVWAWNTGASDRADFYYTGDASNPEWQYIGTVTPPSGGANDLMMSYTLPQGSAQAVRVQFRYGVDGGNIDTCIPGEFNDRDDLVFTVGGGVVSPGQSFPIPTPLPTPLREVLPYEAVYDNSLGSPRCINYGSKCDSTDLLNGRGSMFGGNEANKPNTLGVSCIDGNAGSYHSDESIDRIVVTSGEIDGTGSDVDMVEGGRATISATVWPWSTGFDDSADFYFASDSSNPQWQYIGSKKPVGGGLQDIKISYNLPSGLNQAVRVTFRFRGVQGSSGACSTGSYDDNDDLAFAVKTNPSMVEVMNQAMITIESEAQVHDVVADYAKRTELIANKKIRRASKTSKRAKRA